MQNSLGTHLWAVTCTVLEDPHNYDLKIIEIIIFYPAVTLEEGNSPFSGILSVYDKDKEIESYGTICPQQFGQKETGKLFKHSILI